MKTHRRSAIVVATAALLLAVTPSCTDSPGSTPDASRVVTRASAPTTGSSTSQSQSQRASVAATAVLLKYYDVRNKLRRDPDEALTLLDSVAISTELAAERNLFKKEREEGLHQIGETKVAQLEVQSVNLENSDPKSGKVPTVQIDLCFDVTDVDVVDAKGKSIVKPDRPDTGWIRFLVSNYRWDDDPDGGWRVASSQDIERPRCVAS
jgi:hypothetical protein